jgi:hypothetical protein
MTSGHRPLVATMLLAAAGCRAAPQAAPVPLEGSHAELAALAGVWAGRYWSEASGRRGTIAFRLRAGADTAHGEVEMTFSPTLRLYGAKPPADGVPEAPAPCTTIDIAVVRIEGGQIRGTLAPYWDPDCDCRSTSVFEGTLVKDRIDGTFTSRRSTGTHRDIAGRWFAVRQPP